MKDITSNDDTEISPIDIDCADFSNVEIRREWKNIDILLICENAKIIVVIENKIDASESENQLLKYKNTDEFKSTWKDYQKLFVFLTIEGDGAQNDEKWIPYSHKEVIEVLEKSLAANSTNIASDQKVLISHYITLMRRHILSDSKEAKLARKIYKQHKAALDIIFEHKPDLQMEIGEHIKEKIKEAKGFKLVHSSKAYIRFIYNDWEVSQSWKRKGGAYSDAAIALVIYIPPNLEKLELLLVIADLLNKKNKKLLLDGLSKPFPKLLETSGNSYPRAWICNNKFVDIKKKIDKDDLSVINGEINEWLEKIFVEIKKGELDKKVGKVLDEIGARPH